MGALKPSRVAGGGRYGPTPHAWRGDLDLDLACSRFEAQALEVAEGAHSTGLRIVPVQRTVYDDAESQQDDRAKRTDYRTEGASGERQLSGPWRSLAVRFAIHV